MQNQIGAIIKMLMKPQSSQSPQRPQKFNLRWFKVFIKMNFCVLCDAPLRVLRLNVLNLGTIEMVMYTFLQYFHYFQIHHKPNELLR